MIFSYLLNMQSHPSWVCGLKLEKDVEDKGSTLSHPSWVCGLKLFERQEQHTPGRSHPSWVCGLKLNIVSSSNMTYLSHTLRGCVD